MKAVRIHEHGGIEKLRYEEAEAPVLASPDQAIVKLSAAALNHIDIWIRRGLSGGKVVFPHILGRDGAGTVVEVGAQVKNIKPGDPVCLYPPTGCGRCEFCAADREYLCVYLRDFGEKEQGTYAEFARVNARNCFPIPAGLSFEEGAAVPLVYLTVWRMLVVHAALKPGEDVLILGIGGGVASAALQLAVHIGARIIVTSGSDEKLAMAKKYGASHGINYRSSDFASEARRITNKRGVDVVVDCVGGEGWAKSLASLAKGGRLVTCGATTGAHSMTDIRRIFWNNLTIYGSTLGTRQDFKDVLKFIEASRIRPIIDGVFALRDAAAAHQRLERGEQFGKIVLRISE